MTDELFKRTAAITFLFVAVACVAQSYTLNGPGGIISGLLAGIIVGFVVASTVLLLMGIVRSVLGRKKDSNLKH